jgi:hypothetical protein
MKPFVLRGVGVPLHPAVAAESSVAAQMHNVLRFPGSALAALDPVVKAVGLSTATLAQAIGSFCH